MTNRIARSTLIFSGLLMLALAAVASAETAKDAGSALSGDWKGGLKTPAITLMVGFRLITAPDGSMSGYIVDAQNGTGTRARMSNVRVSNGKLTFEQPAMKMKFEGALSGATLRGTWSNPQLGQVPIELTRTTLNVPVIALGLSPKDAAKVLGTWTVESGDSKGVALHFETTPDGKSIGFADLPAFQTAGIPINEATLKDDELHVKIGTIQSEYHARVSPAQMQGEWKYPGGAFQLVMAHQK